MVRRIGVGHFRDEFELDLSQGRCTGKSVGERGSNVALIAIKEGDLDTETDIESCLVIGIGISRADGGNDVWDRLSFGEGMRSLSTLDSESRDRDSPVGFERCSEECVLIGKFREVPGLT